MTEMTPAEWEWFDEQMEHVAELVRNEHDKTGRDIYEILEAMRDEGYIECSDEGLARVAKRAALASS